MSTYQSFKASSDSQECSNGSTQFEIVKTEIFVFRAPIKNPVITSFGIMHDRPAVLIRVKDSQGAHGWGEVWCNFPSCGAEHRARLLETVISPLIMHKVFPHPKEAFEYITAATAILAIQSGEQGPIAQVISAIDIAIWDLISRRNQTPLYRFLGGNEVKDIPAYASGINLKGAAATVERCRREGFADFKVKVGMDNELDLSVVSQVAAELKDQETLMIDANQAWDLDTALEMLKGFNTLPLQFLEEPLRAVQPLAEWKSLKECSDIPIAAGENINSVAGFDDAISSGAFDVIQPDLCKWGGITECLSIARKALAANKRYCPHYLGGGIGLMASAHVLAAAGGDGMLEVDSNPNPLRNLLAMPYPEIKQGRMQLPTTPGLGVEPDLESCQAYIISHRTVH